MESRLIKKAKPIWQELPINAKVIVVEYLDWISRLKLEQCSKSENRLVKLSPFHLKFQFSVNIQGIVIAFGVDGKYKERHFNMEDGVKFFSEVMKHPKSEARGSFEIQFLGNLLENLRKYPKKKYEMSEMVFLGLPRRPGEPANPAMLPFMMELFEQFFSSKKLTFFAPFNTWFYRQLATTGNWKNAEKIEMELMALELNVEEVAHIDSIQFPSRNWTAMDAKKMIKIFQDKALKPNGEEVCFSIDHDGTINPSEAIEENDDDLKKKIYQHREPRIHVQVFPVHSDKSLVLCVMCSDMCFKGKIFSADSYETDFRAFADPFRVVMEEMRRLQRQRRFSRWNVFKSLFCSCLGSSQPDL